MFWVPIAAVVGLIYYVLHLISIVISSQTQAKVDGFLNAEEKLREIAVDEELEEEIDYSLGDIRDLIRWKTIVCDFMGGDPEWADYTTHHSGKLKAKLVLMAQHGKIPHDMVVYGSSLPLMQDRSKGRPRISAKRGREMNESFILKLEEYLAQEKGIDAVAYVHSTGFENGRKVVYSQTLKDFIDKYGQGATHYFTIFRFIYKE